jgi:hypothetical protein
MSRHQCNNTSATTEYRKCSTLRDYTHTVNDDFFRISIPAEICGSRSVWIRSRIPASRWCAVVEFILLLRSPLGSHMRAREMWGRRGELLKGATLICCVFSSSQGASLYRGHPYPHQGNLGPTTREGGSSSRAPPNPNP